MSHTTLIDAATLVRAARPPRWRVFDCRCAATDPAAGLRAYREGHIPGARHADLDRVLAAPPTPQSGRHPLPDRHALAAWLGGEGVDEATQIVAYDDAGGAFAARLWWLVRWLGHREVAVLDGGLRAWQAAGGALARGDEPRPAACDFPVRKPLVRAVDTEGVSAIACGSRAGLLVDARASTRYRGQQEPLDPIAGHIPGAINLPYADNLTPAGVFRSPAELRARFAGLDTDPSETVHYCGSGVTACHNVLAMEHAGFAGSQLYPGSWSEWIRDPQRPIAGPESGR